MSQAGREAFIHRIAFAIDLGVASGQSSLEIATGIADNTLPNSQMLETRKRLLRECGFEPWCWLCGLRIYLDDASDDYAGLSMDHVVPRSCGGTKEGENIRFAHRICNTMRHTPVGRKTKKKVEIMMDRLRMRMDAEESGAA